MRNWFFLFLIATFSIGMIYIFRPFFYPIFWAAIITILFHPIYKKLLVWIKSKNISAVLTVIAVIISIFLPLTIVSILIVNESLNLYSSVSEKNIFGSATVENVNFLLKKIPTILQPYAKEIQNNWFAYGADATKKISEFIFINVKAITQNSVSFVFMLFIMFYTLFFFLRDGHKIISKIKYLSPLGGKYEEMLYEKFISTARATIKGTFVVGIIQGTLGGILFWISGIQGALIWSIVMIVASLIPAVGPFVVWVPAGIFMLAFGNIWQGILILAFGAGVISTIDNFLRPILIGKDIQMHSLIVLFSTLGGLFIFGIAGFIIGPIIASMFMSVISIYTHYYQTELKNN